MEGEGRSPSASPRTGRLQAINPRNSYQLPIASVVLAAIALSFLPCMCGYLDLLALPFTAAAFAIALVGWIVSRKPLPGRLVHMAAVVVTALVLAKNILDILWLGHDPVW